MESFDNIRAVSDQFGTPFYLFHPDKFLNNFEEIRAAFVQRYKHLAIGYSYKTNYLPYLCNLVRQNNGYAEVVSRLEYDLAMKIQHDPHKIIFNGPLKNYDDIETALHNRSLVNLDSWYEIDHVARYGQENPDREIKVGLRVNIDLSDSCGKSHVQAGLRSGRFGFEVGPEGICAAIRNLGKIPKVRIVGLHGHCSSSTRALWVYKRITETLADLATEFLRESLEYIDVGGGFFGRVPPEMSLPDTPGFDDYAETICDALNAHRWIREKQPLLIIEPGIAVTADCMSFITRVMDVKKLAGTNYLIVDGSIFNTKPSMHKHNMPFTFYRSMEHLNTAVYKVGGYTCMEKDILLNDIKTNEVNAGDYLKIDNVGAYTIVLSPPFINSAPPILLKDVNGYSAVRRRQSFEDFFRGYSFEQPASEKRVMTLS
ncbi:MAG: diaminopimelate decarboxylase [Desulfuromonadales bacterium]|nr:diaminopimelate decarboxylase [Desulfuromonadales bacterium]